MPINGALYPELRDTTEIPEYRHQAPAQVIHLNIFPNSNYANIIFLVALFFQGVTIRSNGIGLSGGLGLLGKKKVGLSRGLGLLDPNRVGLFR